LRATRKIVKQNTSVIIRIANALLHAPKRNRGGDLFRVLPASAVFALRDGKSVNHGPTRRSRVTTGRCGGRKSALK
jgi:hypothetical protein